MGKRSFYIASSLDNAEAVRQLAQTLLGRGHWTVHGAAYRPEESAARNVVVMRDVARAEMKGVTTADVVIVLLPGGRGTHVELGGALATGKRVLIVGDRDVRHGDGPRPCAFYHHAAVEHVPPIPELIVEAVERG